MKNQVSDFGFGTCGAEEAEAGQDPGKFTVMRMAQDQEWRWWCNFQTPKGTT